MKDRSRLIGDYDQGEKGPLFICLGAVHGNEPAGVHAIEKVLQLLDEEPDKNRNFVFSGRFVGLIGNLQALHHGMRFIRQDLNRILIPAKLNALMDTQEILEDEDREAVDLVFAIRREIERYRPEQTIILDIHSTSAEGGVFVIAAETARSLRIARELHAPVVLDFGKEVKGTTLSYFQTENFGIEMVTVVFECGQHEESLSVQRAIAAIINCMRTIGCIRAEHVENKHDVLLRTYSEGLPKVVRLIEHHKVPEDKLFLLTKEYRNFEPVQAGEVVAFSGEEPVKAIHSGFILLPRLQQQGDDGFFVVESLIQ
jgi:succinylglutamate desuccinylase